MAIMTTSTETIIKDEDGNIISSETNTDSQNIHKSDEGDFIKIYTESLDKLPANLTVHAFRCLLQLAKYASYADINDLEGGMLIQLSPVIREDIQTILNIKKRTFQDDLKNLVDCNLLRQIRKNCYQLNPDVIGKGYFEYKANYKQGGIKDLREFWAGGCKKRIVTIEDNRYVLSQLVDEVKKLYKQLYQYKQKRDYQKMEEIQNQILKFLKGMKELSQTEYTKYVKYAINADEDINKLKDDEQNKQKEEEAKLKKEAEELQKAMDESSKPLTQEEYNSLFDDDPFNMFS